MLQLTRSAVHRLVIITLNIAKLNAKRFYIVKQNYLLTISSKQKLWARLPSAAWTRSDTHAPFCYDLIFLKERLLKPGIVIVTLNMSIFGTE